MFGQWNRKRAATPTCEQDMPAKRQRFTEGKSKYNSSRLDPASMAKFNYDRKSSAYPNLLSLPAKIRKEIYRQVVVEESPIDVQADDSTACREPGLLMACKNVREDARKIFYADNSFVIHVRDCNIHTVLPWLQISSRFTGSTDEAEPIESAEISDESGSNDEILGSIKGGLNSGHPKIEPEEASEQEEISVAGLHSGPATHTMQQWMQEHSERLDTEVETIQGNTSWSLHPSPNWANLIGWIKLYHGGKVHRYTNPVGATPPYQMISIIFDHAESHVSLDWDHFEPGLLSWRTALATMIDARWLDDEASAQDSDEDETQEESDCNEA